MQRTLPVLLMLLVLAPSATAFWNAPIPYEASSGFTESFEGLPALVSGAVEYEADQARNATLLLGTGGFAVQGLERVCWEDANGNPQCRNSDALTVELQTGGSVAFRAPGGYGVDLEADHALAFFADASKMFGESRQENIALGPSLVAIPTGETIRIHDVDGVPHTPAATYSSFNDAVGDLALLVTMSDTSTLIVRDGSTTLETLSGNGEWVGFQGAPAFSPITANVAALPMPDGTIARFAPGDPQAALEGLAPANLGGAFGSIEESEGQGDANALQNVGDASEALAGFMNGAYLHVAGLGEGDQDAAALLDSITLVRFQEMEAQRNGDQVGYEGAAPLQIQSGEVAGAEPLYGYMPLWGIVLWGIAFTLWIVRLVLKPDKHHATWDSLNWVGLVGGVAAGLLAFFLWDLQMKALWGTSLLTSGASGATLGAIAALQLIPLLLAALFFGAPTRSISKSAFRFMGQGRFMNLGAVLAPFVTLLLGVPLLLSLVALVLQTLGG